MQLSQCCISKNRMVFSHQLIHARNTGQIRYVEIVQSKGTPIYKTKFTRNKKKTTKNADKTTRNARKKHKKIKLELQHLNNITVSLPTQKKQILYI